MLKKAKLRRPRENRVEGQNEGRQEALRARRRPKKVPKSSVAANRVAIGILVAPVVLVSGAALLHGQCDGKSSNDNDKESSESVFSGSKVPLEVIKKARSTTDELIGYNKDVTERDDVAYYRMERIPNMPKTVEGNVLIKIGKKGKIIVYFHANGGQTNSNDGKKGASSVAKLIQCADVQGASVIAPEDKKLHWKGFSPEVINSLSNFTKGITGKEGDLEYHTLSGGNMALLKVLPGMEDKVSKVILYDSEDGGSVGPIANYMTSNPNGAVFGYHSVPAEGPVGWFRDGAKTYIDGYNLLESELRNRHISSSRYEFESLPPGFLGHDVMPDKCETLSTMEVETDAGH